MNTMMTATESWTKGAPPVIGGRYDCLMNGLRLVVTIAGGPPDLPGALGAVTLNPPQFVPGSAARSLGVSIFYDDGGWVPMHRWRQITMHFCIPDPPDPVDGDEEE